MTQKIIAAACGKAYVAAGDVVMANVDIVLGNDITAPVAINEFEKCACKSVFDNKKIALVMDHFVPNKDIKSAEQTKKVREFAGKHNIKHFFDVGETGVEHTLLPEKGIVTAGDLVVGADSHTCTYGALGCFSAGVGSTDMAYAMAYGKAWFKVPKAIKFNLTGKKREGISGKDIILYIIGKIGVDGAAYKSMEFSGEGIKELTMDDRFTICNMAVEAGAKNGIFPVDEATLEFIRERSRKPYRIYEADDGAEYEQTIEVDLSEIGYQVAFPNLPSNVKTFDAIGEVAIDQVVIGSCTNGRYSDFAQAAEVLGNKKIHKNVRAILIPATQEVYIRLAREGLLQKFAEAGCAISTPTCGPCLGGYMGILAEGERCVSTTNRNFVGRMGHPKSEVYLAGPAVAMASAVEGKLAFPKR